MGARQTEEMAGKIIFGNLPGDDRKMLLEQLRMRTGIEEFVLEKDWWVTQVLRALFELPYAQHLSFKGGTSLSKCWGVIDRFSEDIDIGIAREFLGFSGDLSKTQISDKLRRAACSFVRERLQHELREQMKSNGIDGDAFSVRVNITSVTTTDPEIIELEYSSAMGEHPYLRHVVKIEVSGRSMHEPLKGHGIRSLIAENLPDSVFAEDSCPIMAVVPERTFLEKVMLLHEEFAKPLPSIRTERMSRHMYDLYRMLQTPIADRALSDCDLYRAVMEHRRKFIGLKGFDYDTLLPATLSLVIPANVESLWREDYEKMCRTMIYGEKPSWNLLVESISALQSRIRNIAF